MDRFLMQLSMENLSETEELQLMERYMHNTPLETLEAVTDTQTILALQESCKQVYIHPELSKYLVAIIHATRTNGKIACGVSPRGTLAFLRAAQAYAMVSGRDYVVPEDLKALAVPVLSHRLTMATGIDSGRATEQVIEEILASLPVPTENFAVR